MKTLQDLDATAVEGVLLTVTKINLEAYACNKRLVNSRIASDASPEQRHQRMMAGRTAERRPSRT